VLGGGGGGGGCNGGVLGLGVFGLLFFFPPPIKNDWGVVWFEGLGGGFPLWGGGGGGAGEVATDRV